MSIREHKYRGQGVDTKKWVYGWYVEADGKSFIVKAGNDNCVYDKPIRICGLVEVIPETVGEYTGLKDKNKIKICEGDIVKYTGNCTMVYSPITFCEREACYKIDGGGYLAALLQNWRRCEVMVIGNIHENPELLDAQSKS